MGVDGSFDMRRRSNVFVMDKRLSRNRHATVMEASQGWRIGQGGRAVAVGQPYDPKAESAGVILVIRRIISTPARLSEPMYKICTSPSTGIVENLVRGNRPNG
jgi:hypothetical protein